jgi:Squalene-hopene cyclase C-terminal domain/Prenyltransferase and squalene oxidase repeat
MAWRSKVRATGSVRCSLALSLALGLAVFGYAVCSAFATPNNEANKSRLDSTVRFLESAQNSDGGFTVNGDAGEPSAPEFTAWAAIGLAAAGINPQNQARQGGESAYAYLADHASGLALTTDFERVLLVVDAAGTAPQNFGGVNLVKAILQRQPPEGEFVHEEGGQSPGINDTIFAILALSPIQEPTVQETVKRAVKWLEGEQNSDGSWPSSCPKTVPGCVNDGKDPPGETDMTAAAIEALNAAGSGDAEAQRKALGYLQEAQRSDGGFPESATGVESDTASTSWTVQAIWSAGENPETWKQKGSDKNPLDYLESMQREDGSVQLSAGSDANPVWMTAYAAPAFSGQPLPVPAVPLAIHSTAPPSGNGVIAGGGGEGAPLFSRPQPQSTGHTPGGARKLRRSRRRAGKTATRHSPSPDHRAAALAIAKPIAGKRAASAAHGHDRGAGSGSAPPLVTGLLIDAADRSPERALAESGAPGLRSASTSGNQTSWLAIAIGGLIVLLILAGSLLELRRPKVIL